MVDKVSGVPLVNPVTAQIPNFVLQQLQAQRNQQLAQTLQTQGMSPIDYDPHGRISWTQGLAKALQTGAGLALGNDAMSQQAGLQQQGMQAMAPMYGFGSQPSPQALAAAINPADASHAALAQGAQQGSVGPTNSNAALMTALAGKAQPPASSAPTSAAPMNPFGAPPMLAYAASNGDPAALEQMKTFGANATSTPEMKNNSAFGISPEMARSMAISKASNEGFHAFTPGETWTNTFTGQGGFAPKVPENSQPNAPFTPGSPIPSVSPVPGSQTVAQANAQATATGTTAGTPHTVTNPDGSQTTGLGGNLFQIPPAQQASENAEQIRVMQDELSNRNLSPQDRASVQAEIRRIQSTGSQTGVPQSRAVTGPDPTVQSGRTDQQSDMGKRWSALSSQAGNAQKVNSYLDNIGSLADKAATGQFSDRLQLTNSLLAPFSQRATDATTASNLLDKYSNQIVAQLGSGGGMSTDAARDILHSAYPNRAMNAPAIHEAVNALKAQSVMAQAKARILQPAYTSNDPVSYTKAETAFDQAADPRIFQWRAIADPAARRAFGAKIMAQDPSLAAKAKALEAMGVQ